MIAPATILILLILLFGMFFGYLIGEVCWRYKCGQPLLHGEWKRDRDQLLEENEELRMMIAGLVNPDPEKAAAKRKEIYELLHKAMLRKGIEK